jgi:hypothetical protein
MREEFHMRSFLFCTCLIVGLAPVHPATQTPQPPARVLSFADAGWTLAGHNTTITREDGRDVLHLETGTAFRTDISMRDGTIDLDVRVTDRRSFVYLHFRMQSEDEHEEIYLRPHKSNLPDALQYAPVWQGESAWQLHHGPGGTAATALPPGVWTHVRLIVEGRRAALFVGDMATPALLIPALAREPQAGFVGLGGFLPANVPGTGAIAEFADVVVHPGPSAFDFASAIAKAAEPPAMSDALLVREWSVSKAMATTPLATVPTLPASAMPEQIVSSAPDGLVELHRDVTLPGTPLASAVARITVTAERAGLYAMDLGFSDVATVFVNGRPIFTRDDSYSFDRPRREGLIGFDQARVYLALNAGPNQIAILISDRFGGWGVMARFPSPDGVRVSTR